MWSARVALAVALSKPTKAKSAAHTSLVAASALGHSLTKTEPDIAGAISVAISTNCSPRYASNRRLEEARDALWESLWTCSASWEGGVESLTLARDGAGGGCVGFRGAVVVLVVVVEALADVGVGPSVGCDRANFNC